MTPFQMQQYLPTLLLKSDIPFQKIQLILQSSIPPIYDNERHSYLPPFIAGRSYSVDSNELDFIF